MPNRLHQTLFAPPALKQMTCAVVGTGALGSEVVRLLGQLGLGRVLLIDPDVITPPNLPHSIFFRGETRLGEAKVHAIGRGMTNLFPETEWTALQQEIADVPLQSLVSTDLLFSCPDTVLARMELSHVARRLTKPSIDAALLGESWWRGRVAFFPAEIDASCYLCQFTEHARADLLAYTVSCSPGCSSQLPLADLASTPVMASAVASLAVDVGLRQLLGPIPKTPSPIDTGVQGSFALDLTLAGSRSELRTHTLARSSTCPWHELTLRSDLRELVATDHTAGSGTTMANMLEAHGLETLELEWPVVTHARCLQCGDESVPFIRVANFRRSSTCFHCGAANLLPVKTIHEVHLKSSEAGRKLADFGLTVPFLASVR